MTPGGLEPSPQSIVAVKSLPGAPVLSSLKLREAFVGAPREVEDGTVNVPAWSAASATVAVEFAVSVLPASSTSLIVTVTEYDPSSVYVCVPATLKLPAEPLIDPADVAEPSPQSTVAEYSLAVAAVSGSVKVATAPLKLAPSVAEKVVAPAVIGWSPSSTVIGAVSPVATTATAPASPPALLKYVPGVVDTVTLKCKLTSPPAGVLNEPSQVRD